jgi:RNA polymerase sigma-70 factor (ECF subfamily)
MADIPATRASLLVRLRDLQDEAAWRSFVDLYAPVVYGYLRKQRLQDADAADLAQEVLRAVAGAVGRLDFDPRRGQFRNWLFTVVRRKLWKWRTAPANRIHASGEDGTDQLLQQYPAPADDDATWQAECQQQLFAWACTRIRPEVTDATWQAFWRTAVEGQPGKRVAAELGMTLAAVYCARSRVVARLKDLIQSVQEPE